VEFGKAKDAPSSTFFCALTLGFEHPHRVCVWLAAGLCRGRGSLFWYPANFAAPAGALFTIAQASAEAGKFAWYKKWRRFIQYPAKLRRRPQPPPNRRLFTTAQIA